MQILKAGRSAADCVAYYKAYNPRKTVTLTILKRFFFILLFVLQNSIEIVCIVYCTFSLTGRYRIVEELSYSVMSCKYIT